MLGVYFHFGLRWYTLSVPLKDRVTVTFSFDSNRVNILSHSSKKRFLYYWTNKYVLSTALARYKK